MFTSFSYDAFDINKKPCWDADMHINMEVKHAQDSLKIISSCCPVNADLIYFSNHWPNEMYLFQNWKPSHSPISVRTDVR
jgi:iron only hydrogenase large subunit-like protein